jgi:hypothetical protein
MKSQGLPKLVRQIYSDPQTRAEFVADPESVLARFELSREEKQAVLQTHFKRGLLTSGSAQLEATIEPMTWWVSPTP